MGIGSEFMGDAAIYPVVKDGQIAVQLGQCSTIVEMGFPDTNEIDLKWTPISPGDHIHFSAWFQTSASTTEEQGCFTGARLGMDIYAAGRICEVSDPNGLAMYPNYPSSSLQCVVHWGTTTWTKVTLDFTVPASYMSDPWGGYGAGGTQVVPTGMIPWILVDSDKPTAETGNVWFYGTELYINP